MAHVYPSLIASDLLNLTTTIKTLERLCAGFHIDVMDYHFVQNLSFGPDLVNAIRKIAKKKLWVHLMADEPKKYIDRLHLYHGDIVSVHYETMSESMTHKIARELHSRKLIFSIALNPDTPIEVIKPYFQEKIFEQVLLLSVQPGFSGQTMLPKSAHKLEALHDLKEEHNQKFSLGMDGGITMEALPELLRNGIDDVVVGSAIFSASDPVEKIKQMVTMCAEHRK